MTECSSPDTKNQALFKAIYNGVWDHVCHHHRNACYPDAMRIEIERDVGGIVEFVCDEAEKVYGAPDSALRAAKEFIDDEFSECSDLPRKTRLAALSELIDAALRAPALADPAGREAIAQTFLDEDYQDKQLDSFDMADIMLRHFDVRCKSG
jgi:hypothetical protein